jgi:hypothetical protein
MKQYTKHSTNNTKHSKYKHTYYQNTHTLQNSHTYTRTVCGLLNEAVGSSGYIASNCRKMGEWVGNDVKGSDAPPV